MKHHYRSLAAAILLAGFLLGIRNGQVAIWKDDDPQPIRIFPWSAAILPAQIRKALEKGIYVDETSDIGLLIQDMIC